MENTISAGGGMRFYPTDEELIRLYLLPKVAGIHLPLGGYVLEADLYGRPPWEIFEECSTSAARNGDSKERVKYFFTKLKKRSKKRFNRHVGDFGTWHGSDNADRIFHGTCDIGRVRSFSYKNKGDSEHNGKFLMKEYSLSESMRLSIQKLFHDHKVDEEFVVCRIKRKKEKKDPSRDGLGLRNDQHQIYEEMVLNLLNQSGSEGGGVASQSIPCNVAVNSFATNTEFMQAYGGVEDYSVVPAIGDPCDVVNHSEPLEGAPELLASQEQQEGTMVWDDQIYEQMVLSPLNQSAVLQEGGVAQSIPCNEAVNSFTTNTESMQAYGGVEHCSEPLEGAPQLLASQEQQEGTMVWDDPNIFNSQATEEADDDLYCLLFSP